MNQRRKPCAACKYQKRKCPEGCPLAPHFPASRYLKFMHSHKHFNVSSVTKILSQVKPDQREAAIQSMVMECMARKDDPVKGIVGIIENLQSQIQSCKREVAIVKEQLRFCQRRDELIRSQQRERLEQLQRQQRFLSFTPSPSTSPFLKLCPYQMPTLPNSVNIGLHRGITSFSTPEEVKDVKPLIIQNSTSRVNQGCTNHSTPPVLEDIKPLINQTSTTRVMEVSRHTKSHNFKDAGKSRKGVAITMKELNQAWTNPSISPGYEDIKPFQVNTKTHINMKEAGESSVEAIPKEKQANDRFLKKN
ncbi:LOB domain-containing protein 13-like [Macadamia integrifolia]|uniref:LOB domain-containing protein 13-like n=1 Tax=Macadamia integrifolia TaxID=60698 RepID=UPI001C4E58D1|nr:LOB domain-containing protein 13-like [Macadamia integrifolia]